jgi:hypothetical protein
VLLPEFGERFLDRSQSSLEVTTAPQGADGPEHLHREIFVVDHDVETILEWTDQCEDGERA